jgi:hypothetical protein
MPEMIALKAGSKGMARIRDSAVVANIQSGAKT